MHEPRGLIARSFEDSDPVFTPRRTRDPEGTAIVRAHNRWARDWTVLVTLSGWFFLGLGLLRTFAAGLYQRGSANTSATVFMVLEGVLLVLGLVMTFKAYRRDDR
jgi:hypothetical protein